MSGSATGKDIHAWIEGLEAQACDDHDEFVRKVTRFIKLHPVCRESLEPYAFWDDHQYTRNLIHKSELFEVMALCWQVGNMSSIHNHRDQQCWMTVAEGRLENINFRVLDRDPVAQTCRIEPGDTHVITRMTPIVVDDDEPVHQIVNCPDHGTRALSVHVYSRPFDTCEVYCLLTGKYQDVQLSYWSEFGTLVKTQAPDPCVC